jgi:hypothetical protein
VKEQYLYLEVVNNPLSEEYNGAIIKLKFQHIQIKREFLLGQLLNSYLYFEKGKVLPLAYFWLFFLKINGFVGRSRGYLSASAYLMMLVNYLQNQYLLPNLQDYRLIKGSNEQESSSSTIVIDRAKYLHQERLTTKEREKYGL